MKHARPGYLLTESMIALLIAGLSLTAFLTLQGTLVKLTMRATTLIQDTLALKSSLYNPPEIDNRKIGFSREATESKASYVIKAIDKKSALKQFKRCAVVESSLNENSLVSFIFLKQEKEKQEKKP